MSAREESKVIGEIGFDSLVEGGGSVDILDNDSYVKIPSTGSKNESIQLGNGGSVEALSLKLQSVGENKDVVGDGSPVKESIASAALMQVRE